jgi:hypothetical protein
MLKNSLLLLVALALAFPLLALADPPKDKADKAEADLVKALKDADAVFTAKVGKVEPLGQTNSIPASVFGKVSFKDPKALRGELPKATTFSFSYREGMTGLMDLEAKDDVIVAVKKDGVSVVVAASEANLALAKKALGQEK